MKAYRKEWIVIVLSSMALILLCSCLGNIKSRALLELKEVPVACCDLKPRKRIEKGDYVMKEVPSAYLPTYVIQEEKEVLGKYLEIQGMVPCGSFFYESMLYDQSELPDYPESLLKEGQAAYTMPIDLARLGGSKVVNQRVDVHVSITKDGNKPVCGCLFKGARILAIKDHNGYDLDDKKSSKTPHLVVLAISNDDVSYLSKAEELGTIRLIATQVTYDDVEATLIRDSEVFMALLD